MAPGRKAKDRHIGVGLGAATRAMAGAMRRGKLIIAATDGGSSGQSPLDRLGAWALHAEQISVGGVQPGMDQGAPACEAWAATQCFAALADARAWRFVLLIDNLQTVRGAKAAIQGAVLKTTYRAAWRSIADSVARAVACKPSSGTSGLEHPSVDAPMVFWVPSHGKRAGEWIPPLHLEDRVCRALNDAADKVATQHLERHEAIWRPERDAFRAAESWATLALSSLHEAAMEYEGACAASADGTLPSSAVVPAGGGTRTPASVAVFAPRSGTRKREAGSGPGGAAATHGRHVRRRFPALRRRRRQRVLGADGGRAAPASKRPRILRPPKRIFDDNKHVGTLVDLGSDLGRKRAKLHIGQTGRKRGSEHHTEEPAEKKARTTSAASAGGTRAATRPRASGTDGTPAHRKVPRKR